tara:strand:- start:1593 stop:1886 length:294 start_codon:yes stop_codon:yes gene_type:complete
MWWVFFILFILVSIFSTTALFYALRRINQYENFIVKMQQMIEYSTERMKLVDNKGSFEADDEVGFFFKQLKDIQLLLSDIFETETNEEKIDGKEKTR